MEEDVGGKAPVTRLRRRLSVEQSEEVKSPSAPSTPSKKRGGRLVAKPQLELIDENSSENSLKNQTKKLAAKDVIEASEEKVLTPSLRSTRIKSNTSIISDTPQSFDSPRAKRAAARRYSQIGSDNEAPVTPARQTRRTRKDSTSSIDKQETITSVQKQTTVADSIIEERESDSQKSNENSEITPIRKSLRLLKKTKQDEDEIQENNRTSNKTEISDDSLNLIKNLDDQPVNKNKLNNSTSSVNPKNTKRNRTNSWTAAQNVSNNNDDQDKTEAKEKSDITINNANKSNTEVDNNIISTHVIEKDIKEGFNLSSKEKRSSISSQNSKSEIYPDITSKDNTDNDRPLNETEKLFEKAPVAVVQSLIYFDDSDSDSRGKRNSDKPIETEDQCVPVVTEINQETKASNNDSCEPMDIDETIPNNESLINSSESRQEKETLEKSQEHILIAQESLNKSHNKSKRQSITLLLEKSQEHIVNYQENFNKSHDKSKRECTTLLLEKSQEQNLQENVHKSPNKSKRESTSSLSTSQNIEKIGNENKSTLILSQLKDVSTTDNSLIKSPKTAVEDLSKSINDIKKETDKDNTKKSLEYMTSTPLQQKNLKKMAMKINTSVINNSNNGSMKVPAGDKNDSNQLNKSAPDTSDDESDSEHISTRDKIDFLDDEAEEASDDYESGDSQDEEERQYEKENEIVEKGETLDSSDEDSNDTDYEKDSFVVSSDAEKDDLLSGSGDDLSMSNNELTMSKKSKKKYNERKLKEQKKASREMFEARHNMSNNSSKSEDIKSKKYKRQRLNSSTMVSEEEIVKKTKKNKKYLLDSSQDSSIGDGTDSKLTKNNMSVTDEHEMTSVCNESIMNKNDPLSMKVKSEPQTPLKDINISTVPILDDIEEVQMGQNVSIMKPTETSDPLQDEESDVSSISENMEIASNYDSVLKELNAEVKNKKIKSLDMSLNLNKKSKQSANASIVDILNLTNTKKQNHSGNRTPMDSKTSNKLSNSNIEESEHKNDFDKFSSDSIDVQLLFSEDSCDGMKKKKQHTESVDFIPLKRTEAKTNILEDINQDSAQIQGDNNTSKNQDTLNTSIDRKKKKKNSISFREQIHNVTSEKWNTSLNKINLDASVNSVLNTSSKNKKNRISTSMTEETEGNDEKAPQRNADISLNTSSKKKKKNSISFGREIEDEDSTNRYDHEHFYSQGDAINISLNTSSKKKKKKHSVSLCEETDDFVNKSQIQQNVSHDQINHDTSLNTTFNTSSKKKKKKHSLSVSEEVEVITNDILLNSHLNESNLSLNKNNKDMSVNTTLNTSSKKKKKGSISICEDTDNKNNVSVNKSNLDISVNSALNSSSKKKKKSSISIENEQIESDSKSIGVINSSISNDALTESSKKKKKRNNSIVTDSDVTTTDKIDKNESLNTSSNKKKKVKAAKLQTIDKGSQDDDDDAAPEEVPYSSHKNTSSGDLSGYIFVDTEGNQDWNTLITNGSSKKKNKKKKNIQEEQPGTNELVLPEINSKETATSKNRKRKSSANSTSQETATESPEATNEPVYAENKRKKQKRSQPEDTPCEIKESTNKRNKKRKNRDDDDTNKTSKVFKQSSTDKASVPRLPPTILDQLEDKPRKEVLELKKAKVVSTTQFTVKEAIRRKNKPSNYLEESVYLNDEVDGTKQKGFIKIPKVLPFVPTATISGSGFTTKFQINVLQKETKFVAQTSNLSGFKNEYLGGRKIKKVGTYEMYKSQRNRMLSKF